MRLRVLICAGILPAAEFSLFMSSSASSLKAVLLTCGCIFWNYWCLQSFSTCCTLKLLLPCAGDLVIFFLKWIIYLMMIGMHLLPLRMLHRLIMPGRLHHFNLLIMTRYLLLLLRVENQMRSSFDLLLYKVCLLCFSFLLTLTLSRDWLPTRLGNCRASTSRH
jgi:hypothetical protein